jgi:hypothetical protein
METPHVQHGEHSARPTVPRFSLGVAGLLLVVLGAWGGIVPFIGPTFGFSADGKGSWHWELTHALLSLAPGAAALLAGLLIMTGAGTRVFHTALTSILGKPCRDAQGRSESDARSKTTWSGSYIDPRRSGPR